MLVRYKSLFLSTRASCRSPGDPAWFKASSTTPPLCFIGGASTSDRAVPSSNKCTTETEKSGSHNYHLDSSVINTCSFTYMYIHNPKQKGFFLCFSVISHQTLIKMGIDVKGKKRVMGMEAVITYI